MRNCQWSLLLYFFCKLWIFLNHIESDISVSDLQHDVNKKSFEIDGTWNSMETRTAPFMVNSRRTSAIAWRMFVLSNRAMAKNRSSQAPRWHYQQLREMLKSEASLGKHCGLHVFGVSSWWCYNSQTKLAWLTNKQHKISLTDVLCFTFIYWGWLSDIGFSFHNLIFKVNFARKIRNEKIET